MSTDRANPVEVWAPDGIGEVQPGDDLAGLVLRHLDPMSGDIVVVTSKVVSKAEGRVRPGPVAASLAAETERVLARTGPIVIVRSRLGITHAMAGLDASNVAVGTHALLPLDPDLSAHQLRAAIWERTGSNVGVLVSDTAGRAWRIGQIEIAVGAAGVVLTEDLRGHWDGYGHLLARTEPCVADELCGAAELVQAKTMRRPIARIRGRADLVCTPQVRGLPAASLNRPEEQDLFGFGTREAVLRAMAADPDDLAAFGAAADPGTLAAALARVVPEATLDWHEAAAERAVVRFSEPTSEGILRAVAFAHGWQVDSARAPSPDAQRLPLVRRLPSASP